MNKVKILVLLLMLLLAGCSQTDNKVTTSSIVAPTINVGLYRSLPSYAGKAIPLNVISSIAKEMVKNPNFSDTGNFILNNEANPAAISKVSSILATSNSIQFMVATPAISNSIASLNIEVQGRAKELVLGNDKIEYIAVHPPELTSSEIVVMLDPGSIKKGSDFVTDFLIRKELAPLQSQYYTKWISLIQSKLNEQYKITLSSEDASDLMILGSIFYKAYPNLVDDTQIPDVIRQGALIIDGIGYYDTVPLLDPLTLSTNDKQVLEANVCARKLALAQGLATVDASNNWSWNKDVDPFNAKWLSIVQTVQDITKVEKC